MTIFNHHGKNLNLYKIFSTNRGNKMGEVSKVGLILSGRVWA